MHVHARHARVLHIPTLPDEADRAGAQAGRRMANTRVAMQDGSITGGLVQEEGAPSTHWSRFVSTVNKPSQFTFGVSKVPTSGTTSRLCTRARTGGFSASAAALFSHIAAAGNGAQLAAGEKSWSAMDFPSFYTQDQDQGAVFWFWWCSVACGERRWWQLRLRL